jgi:hypothetical protein
LANYLGHSSKRRQSLVDLHTRLKAASDLATTASTGATSARPASDPAASATVLSIVDLLGAMQDASAIDEDAEYHRNASIPEGDDEYEAKGTDAGNPSIHEGDDEYEAEGTNVGKRLVKIPSMGATRWLSIVRSSAAVLRNYVVLREHFKQEKEFYTDQLQSSSSHKLQKAATEAGTMHDELTQKRTQAGLIVLNTVGFAILLCVVGICLSNCSYRVSNLFTIVWLCRFSIGSSGPSRISRSRMPTSARFTAKFASSGMACAHF